MRRTLLSSLVLLLLVGAACGSDDDTTTAAPSSTAATPTTVPAAFPTTVTAGNGDVVIEERPDRIISLSPSATEMLFAIGAGDQVVAVDDNSDYPAEAPTTDLSGYQPNVEAIVGFSPDLVVMATDPGGVVQALTDLDVDAALLPAAQRLEDTYAQVELLGTATGHVPESEALVGRLEGDIAALVAEVPDRPQPLTYYHELDDTYFSVTSSTFLGEIYGLAGLENIADAADDGSGYPQLSAEFIVQQDPDAIFLADTECCGQSPATVAARPGWESLRAVKSGAVVPLDDDVASRWGPRIVDFLRVVVEATAALRS